MLELKPTTKSSSYYSPTLKIESKDGKVNLVYKGMTFGPFSYEYLDLFNLLEDAEFVRVMEVMRIINPHHRKETVALMEDFLND